MKKQRIPKTPADCVTIGDKVAYGLWLRQLYEETVFACDAPPSALTEFQDLHPYDPRYPWSHVEWVEEWARKERAKRAIMRLLPNDE
jgi:hypothetical protein